jgi:hypothetical protein
LFGRLRFDGAAGTRTARWSREGLRSRRFVIPGGGELVGAGCICGRAPFTGLDTPHPLWTVIRNRLGRRRRILVPGDALVEYRQRRGVGRLEGAGQPRSEWLRGGADASLDQVA